MNNPLTKERFIKNIQLSKHMRHTGRDPVSPPKLRLIATSFEEILCCARNDGKSLWCLYNHCLEKLTFKFIFLIVRKSH